MTPFARTAAPGPSRGFTLVETLVAALLVSAVLLPASLWLYKTEASRNAREHFQAVQLLEARMNRAMLLRYRSDWSEQMWETPHFRFEIRVVKSAGETRLLGSARNRKGRLMASLEADYFGGEGL